MVKLSKRVMNLESSPTLALAAQAKALKDSGKDVISLTVGEPDWDTFDFIKAAGKKAIDDGITKYLPEAGHPQLIKTIATQISQDLRTEYKPENVTVSTGGKYIIFSAIQSLTDPGDEVLLVNPYWVSYPAMVELAGGVPKIIPTEAKNKFKLTPEALEKAISPKSVMLLLNSPSNPTGEVFSESELKALAEVIRKHPKLVVMSDDIYNRLCFEYPLAPHILHVAPDLKDRVININGVSKSYSMTGWRIGWGAGPKELIAAMSRFQSQSTSSACSISQMAAIEAIKNGDKKVEESRSILKDRCDFFYSKLKDVPGFTLTRPEGAFYVWPDISFYMNKKYKGELVPDSKTFASLLLRDYHVATIPGQFFGMHGYLRFSFAIEKNRIEEAVNRIKSFVADFK